MISTDSQKRILSINGVYQWPSVIRLRRHVSVPYKQVLLTRKNIFRRDSYKCVYCGRSDLPLTVDHVLPRAKGGKDSWENMVCACTKCNNKKGNRTPVEADMKLTHKPFEPNYILFMKNSVSKIDERWKPYLFFR